MVNFLYDPEIVTMQYVKLFEIFINFAT